ncbi:MAG: NUDIX domain-containing protein [Chloroflexi bacterium]|nr:NUDIX domain-containing protein [Chloroflexota bacterium]
MAKISFNPSSNPYGTLRSLQSRITRRGAMAVVLSPDRQKVLLLRREFLVLWDLPGGGVEKNEKAERAAVRETHEETGYEIELDCLVGRYTHQSVYGRGDQLTLAFRGHIVGGKPKHFGLETMGLRWFPVERLPHSLEGLHRQIIADALANAPEPFQRHLPFPRWKLYPARVVFFVFRWINNVIRLVLRHG